MKLIDLLVQELPNRGGWPQGSQYIAADMDGRIDSYENEPELDHSKESWRDSVVGGYEVADIIPPTKVSDWKTSIISREEYEASLFEWDGEGLPPVGAEVEVMSPRLGWTKATVTAITDNWIIAQYEDGIEFAGAHRTVGYGGCWVSDYEGLFRRLKTDEEAERELQCEAAVASLQESLKSSGYGLPDGAAKIVVDAIAQGKVSGLKLID